MANTFADNLGRSATVYGGRTPRRATVDARGRPISRHDWVPAEGPWQSDPELQRLLALPPTRSGAGRGAINGKQMHAVNPEVRRYVDANRARLGIPNNYFPEKNGQLFDPAQNTLRDAAITTGVIAGGALTAGALTGAFAGPAGLGASGTAASTAGGTLPATFASPLGAYPAAVAAMPGAGALAPGAASLALPSLAVESAPGVFSVAPTVGNVASTLPASLATTGAAAGPAVASLFGPTPSTYTPDVPPPTNNQNQNRQNSQKTSFQLPGGITLKDLAGLGVGAFNSFMGNNSANNATAAQAAADKAALDFAMRAYDETAKKEQERFEATEARRAPYRRASLDTLGEFKKLLWNTNEDV